MGDGAFDRGPDAVQRGVAGFADVGEAAAWGVAVRGGRTRRKPGETVACEQPNSSPATSWALSWRNRNRVSTTARYSPTTRRRPFGCCHTPTSTNTPAASSVTCQAGRPVIRSQRGGRPSMISSLHTVEVIYRRAATVTVSDTPRLDHTQPSTLAIHGDDRIVVRVG